MSNDPVDEHLMEVGRLCAHWAYLEWLLELTHWWILGLFDKPLEGRTITGGLSIEVLAKRVHDLAHLKISDSADIEILKRTVKRIDDIKDDRNLAVHGLRSLQSDETILLAVARGKYKNAVEPMSIIRLNSIVVEVASITAELEPLLVRVGVLDKVTAISEHYRYPRQS